MKILIAAAALVVALPAAANAQAAQPAHAEHQGGEHGEDHKGCCDHKNADGTPMECCKPAKDGTRPACCEKAAAKAEHGGHSGHH